MADLKTHFVYIHLGIQDFRRGRKIKDVLKEYDEFADWSRRMIPSAKIIFSLPLPTDINFEAEVLYNFRWRIYDWMHDKDPAGKYLFINFNPNMIDRGLQRPGFYANDGVHLTSAGKGVIMRSFRGFIHNLVKRHFKRR